MMKVEEQHCPFNLLFSHNVPHILIQIFLQLDPQDFERCRQVCRCWRSFIQTWILSSKVNRRKLALARVLSLWDNEEFQEHALEQKGLKWNAVDVEGISCFGNEIFMRIDQSEFLVFRDLKFVMKKRLAETIRVDRFFVGDQLFVVTSVEQALDGVKTKCLVFKKETLDLLRVFYLTDKGDQVTMKRLDGHIYFLQTCQDELKVFKIDDRSGLAKCLESHSLQDLDVDHERVKALMSNESILLVDESGLLIHLDRTKSMSTLTKRFSEALVHVVKKAVLTTRFFGVIYSKVFAGQMDGKLNVKIYDILTGNLLSRCDQIQTYGRTFMSATARFFIFSYADALHNQHFILHRIGAKPDQCDRREFVLNDRPQPMRSMQILRDELLVLSFYRTASALNTFRLDRLFKSCPTDDDANEIGYIERIKLLPPGLIAFQSSHDDCNSQKLVLYKETGVVCQRLDYSCEKLVLTLDFGNRTRGAGPKAANKAGSERPRLLQRFRWKS